MPTVLETSTVPGVRSLYRLSVAVMAASGFFCASFLAVLLYNYHFSGRTVAEVAETVQSTTPEGAPVYSSDPSYRQPATDSFNALPTDYTEFLALKRQLAADKQNEELKDRIRRLDQQYRFEFFKRREIVEKSSYLLLAGSVFFLIAAWTSVVLKRMIPVPKIESSDRVRQKENRRRQLGTLTVLALSMLFVGLAIGLALAPGSAFETVLASKLAEEISQLPEPTVQPGEAATTPAIEPVPDVEEGPLDRDAFLVEAARNWPSFRGFDGSGVAQVTEPAPPIKWDATTDENIAWKTEVPLLGKSSPVVWFDGDGADSKGYVFLSGADEEKRQVFCFDAADGKLLWTADAPSTPESAKPFSISEDTGRAAPTMVVDGRRAFALFANGDLVAVDFSGKVVWSKSLGIPESSYGFSASPALYFDRLIVQYDVGDGEDGKSKILAFDVKTGNVVWETPREIPNSWSSPMVKKIADRYQIVTCGDPFAIAYDPEDGKEIWRAKCLGGDVGPSPAAFGSVVYITNQSPRTSAIDASGTGDVSATSILWQGANALPDTVSPFATEKHLFTLDSYGYMTAYDPSNVKNRRAMFWELEIGGGESEFYSSPLLVGRHVYAFSKNEEGAKGFVVDLDKAATDDNGALTEEAAKAMVVAENPMGEPCVTSPAAVRGRLFIRGSKTLFCISEAGK